VHSRRLGGGGLRPDAGAATSTQVNSWFEVPRSGLGPRPGRPWGIVVLNDACNASVP